MSQKRTVSSLLVGRVMKRPKCDQSQPLQEAALRLLQQHQSVEDLLTEVLNSCDRPESCSIPPTINSPLLISELKREAEHRHVSLSNLSVSVLLHKIKELTHSREEPNCELLPAAKRVQLRVLLESSRELLSQGALCPKQLWQELTRDEKFPKLEVAFHLHSYNIITLNHVFESNGVKPWVVSELKALCSWTPSETEDKQLQERVLTLVVQVLVGTGFDFSLASASQSCRTLSCAVTDYMLFWFLETVEEKETALPGGRGPQLWVELFDPSLCGPLVSADALQRYFTHCLTKTLTYKPRLTVSAAFTLQNEWTFAKTSQLLTNLFCRLAAVFSMQQLFLHLQQILSTHEVNWKHVLSFLSTVLVYNSSAHTSLEELLDSLLRGAFENYDLESVITAFLLARQGALEGTAGFPSYSDWFKKSFGGSSSLHAGSKKALVFLLKFLSDLVPFELPQYLKVHLLHPPFVPMKHRALLLEYVSLAKTRLADLKESLENMGLYEDVSAAPTTQLQCQEVLDVEKAVSLFESTGRISATVMEASIFRRPYFLTRFLPALLTPEVCPVRSNGRMRFIEALKKADKIPVAQYTSYVASCHKQRPQDLLADSHNSPVDVLRVQLSSFRELLLSGNKAELLAQLSRMSHTLSMICPSQSNQTAVIQLPADNSPPELYLQVVGMILRNFCQCILDTSREDPPNKQMVWASKYVLMLADNREVLSSLLLRLWDLFQNQVSSLSAGHVLGLSVLMVHLHSCTSHTPLVELKNVSSGPVCVAEALSSVLSCDTRAHMLFCVRFCVAAVCYGMCRGETDLDHYIPSSIYKKLLYLLPRLVPEARTTDDEAMGDILVTWKSSVESCSSWTKSALSLWRNPVFHSLQLKPQYQLLFSDWLHYELQVCRSQDALSDPERQEYQQWACMDVFLPRAEQEGGCGGDIRTLCCRLISAVLDQGQENVGDQHHKGTESCLPDVLSRLQECVYQISLTGPSHRATLGRYLLELVSQKVSSSVQSGVPSICMEGHLHNTIRSWNRVLLALPAELFIDVTQAGGRSSLDCSLLTEHINQHQRAVCSTAYLLPCHVTTHFLKGVLCASAYCGQPSEEFNKTWTQISMGCPLLLVSTVYWWGHMSKVLQSLWRQLCNKQPLPDQLLLLCHCHDWAHRLLHGQVVPTPSAPSLQLAASLYRALQDHGCPGNSYISALKREQHTAEVLVFLFSLCINHYLSSLLHPEKNTWHTAGTCAALLRELVDSADWMSIFKSTEPSLSQPVSMMTSDKYNRLMPWAFYSLLCQQSSEVLLRAACCPGFIRTAVLCYISLLRLFTEGHTPTQGSSSSSTQVEPSQIVGQSKKLLLRSISQMPGAALSSRQNRQLQDLCADLDPEVTAALRLHHDQSDLSPELDFL